MVPERIASLILVSTAPRLFSTVVSLSSPTLRQPFAEHLKGWFQNIRDRINMLFVALSFHVADDQLLIVAP